jgi:hypothetical protein
VGPEFRRQGVDQEGVVGLAGLQAVVDEAKAQGRGVAVAALQRRFCVALDSKPFDAGEPGLLEQFGADRGLAAARDT